MEQTSAFGVHNFTLEEQKCYLLLMHKYGLIDHKMAVCMLAKTVGSKNLLENIATPAASGVSGIVCCIKKKKN